MKNLSETNDYELVEELENQEDFLDEMDRDMSEYPSMFGEPSENLNRYNEIYDNVQALRKEALNRGLIVD